MVAYPALGSNEMALIQAEFIAWDKACDRALSEAQAYAAIGDTQQASRSMARYERFIRSGPSNYLKDESAMLDD